MNTYSRTKAYTDIGVESGVAGADPHKLIAMLFQGALLAIASAKNALSRNDIPAKGAAISKALLIIGEGLQASLDKNVGGELALSLDQLYSYMLSRLLLANLHNDPEILDEVSRLLGEIKDAWDAIRQTATSSSAPAQQATPPQNKKTELVYSRM